MKVFIDTLGCAKNEYDSQTLAASLIERGCDIVYDTRDADVLIVNTCGFIEAAKKESINRIFELANYKEIDRHKKLIVTGCLSERYHDELKYEMPEVDCFFGVNDYDRIPDIIMSENPDAARIKDNVGSDLDNLPYRKRHLDSYDALYDSEYKSHYGYLKIAEGCNNACSFCAIPLIRGPYRSKHIEDCIREAEDMAAYGIKELILIAQDTSRYGMDLYGEPKLPELLRRLCNIQGIEWIRLMYVYDNGITDDLINTIKNEPKICNYIDMPVQHISDNVLKRMRRSSSGDGIKTVIKKLRDQIPDVHIRTTLLLGSPGEDEKDFQDLLDFIDSFEIDRLGAFAFSDEEGTEAYNMKDKVPADEAEKRRDLVMRHQLAVSEELNKRKVGEVFDVIVDECIEIDAEDRVRDFNYATDEELADIVCVYEGRTRYDAPDIDCSVTFSTTDDSLQPGDIVKVLITNAYEYDLEGKELS